MKGRVVWAVTMAALAACGGRGNEASAQGVGPREPYDALLAPDRNGRESALKSLIDRRKRSAIELAARLSTVVRKPDLTYHGRLDVTCEAVGAYRISEAVPTLVSVVELRLDKSSFPAGRRIAAERLYPAALALLRVGDRAMIGELIGRIAKSDDEAVLRPALWVLRSHFGTEEAARALTDAAKHWTDIDAERRVERAKALLKDPVLLRY